MTDSSILTTGFLTKRFGPRVMTGVRRPSQSGWLEYLENGLTLESPNLTRTSMQTCSTSTPDMTSLTTFGQKLLRKKNCQNAPRMASGGISRERCKRGSRNFLTVTTCSRLPCCIYKMSILWVT